MTLPKSISLLLFSVSLPSLALGEVRPALKLSSDEVQRLGLATASLTQEVISDAILTTGELTLDPSRRRTVGSFFAGQIQRDRKQIGEPILAGEELYQLQSREVGELLSDFLEKSEKLETASTILEREKRLRAKSLTTEDAYLEAAAALREARAAQVASMQMARMVRNPQELSALREGGITDRFTALSIPAPLSGVVIAKSKVAGDSVAANEELCTIADLSQLLVELRIPLPARDRVRLGESVAFQTVVGPSQHGSAKVVRINPVASGQSLTTTAYATLANDEGLWIAGTPVKAELVDPAAEKKTAAPASAIVRIEGSPHLFVAEGAGRFRPLRVELGASSQQWVEVITPIPPGTEIVVTRASLLLAAYETRTSN